MPLRQAGLRLSHSLTHGQIRVMGRRQPVARELAIRNAALRYAGRMCAPKDYQVKRPCWQDAADCARACSLAAWLSEPQDDDHWIAAVPVRGPCPGHRGTTVAPSGMLSRRCARKEVEPKDNKVPVALSAVPLLPGPGSAG